MTTYLDQAAYDRDHGRRENNTQLVGTRETITIGPLGLFFSNKNDEMGLAGHSHHAQIFFVFETLGSFGFPAFADTYEVIQEWLVGATAAPFRNATNEEVLRRLYEQLEDKLAEWRSTDTALERRGGAYWLTGADLDVRGTFDKIGHADGWTRYSIRRVSDHEGA